MRNNGIFVILALAFVITISAIGDEDALAPSLDLAVEPIFVPIEPSISTAALRNDFVSFDSLYKRADAGGENISRWTALHDFWTWSMTDPVGGFYGQETHDRFAREYTGYARFIEDYRIVDTNGVAFYPSAETRIFLLQNIGQAPVRIAAARTPRPEVSQRPLRASPPVVSRPRHAPERIVSVPVPVPAPVLVAAPAPAAIRVAAAPIAAVPVAVAAPTPRPAARAGVGRGIFLIIVGLIGVGVLSVMLHASGEEPHTISHS